MGVQVIESGAGSESRRGVEKVIARLIRTFSQVGNEAAVTGSQGGRVSER